MKENKIQSNFTNSAWVSKEDTSIHVTSSTPIETTNTNELIEAILNEFELTDSVDTEELRAKLLNWIETMPSVQSTMQNQEKIRDFIYEMF